MYGTFEMMPGPTDEARTLQLAQTELVEALYEAWRSVPQELSFKEGREVPAVVAARTAYDANVAQLVALLGPTAFCHQVDSDLWECFHNVYKDDVGCRPYGGWLWVDVTAYLERRVMEQEAGEDEAAAVRT